MSDPLELIKQAEKKAQPTTGFFKFMSNDADKFEEAADLYVQAANSYRVSKQVGSAGECFMKAAECQLKAGNDNEAGNTFVEAFKMLKSFEPSKAAESLDKAISIFTAKTGQFRRAANYQFDLGELYETSLNDFPKAIAAYEAAGEWYGQDSATSLSNKSYLKCADLKALDNQFFEAVQIYNKVVENSLGNRLSAWSLKEYYLKIGLCHLAATDAVAAKKTLQDAQRNTDDPNCREYQLLSTLIDCYNEQDAEKLSAAVFDFDRFSKLDNWKTTILLKIKDSLISQEDDDLL
ncbi:hypothetical protein ACO0RG_000063 [Hanseniaspora osmophila]|uniref:Vesicular-fusion protein SEC17 n=1 Tax=Hanseniaspora osmophila TaxID=56408 RepID=A0A1E5R4J4_9ASCO|nr:Vesicular-fusion protein SEC17 [Hanseniaspora osmophila]